MSFIEKCLSGDAFIDEIDSYEEAWHSGQEGQDMELHEFLGMSWNEYSLWATKPSILPSIIRCRKKGIKLEDELNQERYALAARAESLKEAEKMTQWLKRVGKLS
jgi:hypothetical protein